MIILIHQADYLAADTKALVVASQSDNKAEILEQLKEALMFLDSSPCPPLSTRKL